MKRALNIPPELEQRVAALAEETHREPQAVLTGLLGAALDQDAVVRAEVRAGVADGLEPLRQVIRAIEATMRKAVEDERTSAQEPRS